MRVSVWICVLSLALVALAVAVWRHTGDAEWQGWQRAYGCDAPEIAQDIVRGFGAERVDRCRSCHAAVEDPAWVDGTQPLRTHPPIGPHPLAEFGCTICHGGDGRALTTRAAHGQDASAQEPMLLGRLLEANCARCHDAPYPTGADHLRRGRERFEQGACAGCHGLRGLARGTLGPALDEVGRRRTLTYLRESIVDPRANDPSSRMPAFAMPDPDREDLLVFLTSLRGPGIHEDPVTQRRRARAWRDAQPAEVAMDAASGQRAFETGRCVACHRLGELDGRVAPDLSHTALQRAPRWIAEHLADPRAHVPDSAMPSLWLSASERAAIAIYLETAPRAELPASPPETYGALCARCHGPQGDGLGLGAGALLPRPRALTNARFFNHQPEERPIASILEGVPGTAMPPFEKVLGRERAQALWTWIRATFVREARNPRVSRLAAPERTAPPPDEASIARGADTFAVRCVLCHGRRGDGRGPAALDLLPRPRNLRNISFLTNLSDARLFASVSWGIVGTGMPPWESLPVATRWDLVDFVRSLSRRP